MSWSFSLIKSLIKQLDWLPSISSPWFCQCCKKGYILPKSRNFCFPQPSVWHSSPKCWSHSGSFASSLASHLDVTKVPLHIAPLVHVRTNSVYANLRKIEMWKRMKDGSIKGYTTVCSLYSPRAPGSSHTRRFPSLVHPLVLVLHRLSLQLWEQTVSPGKGECENCIATRSEWHIHPQCVTVVLSTLYSGSHSSLQYSQAHVCICTCIHL